MQAKAYVLKWKKLYELIRALQSALLEESSVQKQVTWCRTLPLLWQYLIPDFGTHQNYVFFYITLLCYIEFYFLTGFHCLWLTGKQMCEEITKKWVIKASINGSLDRVSLGNPCATSSQTPYCCKKNFSLGKQMGKVIC